MKLNTTALVGLGIGLILQAAPAAAWWQWYQQDIPYAPGLWFYQNLPPSTVPAQPGMWFYQTPMPSQAPPWHWQYQSVPQGAMTTWSSAAPTSNLFVAQTQSPAGYSIRVYSGQPAAQDVSIGIEGGALLIRRSSAAGSAPGAPLQARQFGWSTQVLALPADANIAGMRLQRGNGVVEIFIPRVG